MRSSDSWSRLSLLESFFSPPAVGTAELAETLRVSLDEMRETLWRREQRVTVFGAFKVGKSSVLNGLIGAPLLPVRSGRSTEVPILIEYAERPAATVKRRREDAVVEEEIALPAVSQLFRSPGDERPEEIRVRAPLPGLLEGWVVVDTPGLFERVAVTERALDEIEHTDLAVMVLAADKILSAQERDLARRIHSLLNGNLVYIINRLDLVEEDEREEILAWVERALQGSGNRLVGAPRIFAAELASGTRAVSEIHDWLASVLTTSLGDEVAVLSRLGRLDAQVRGLTLALRERHDEAARVAQQERDREASAVEQERAAIRNGIGEARLRLQARKEALPVLTERFVSACVEDALESMKPVTSRTPIRIPTESTLQAFAEGLSEEVQGALTDVPVTVPSLDLSGWLVREEVTPASHPAHELGRTLGEVVGGAFDAGATGPDTGASLGGWVTKNVFGVDLQRETARRVEDLARRMVQSLREEGERYIARVDVLLAEADRYFSGWSRQSARVEEADAKQRELEALVRWSEDFRRRVQSLAREMMG